MASLLRAAQPLRDMARAALPCMEGVTSRAVHGKPAYMPYQRSGISARNAAAVQPPDAHGPGVRVPVTMPSWGGAQISEAEHAAQLQDLVKARISPSVHMPVKPLERRAAEQSVKVGGAAEGL